VGNDESFLVKHDREKTINNDETTIIGNDRAEKVGNDENLKIGNDQNLTIGHDQSNHIMNSQFNKIDKDKVTKVLNSRVDETYVNHKMIVGKDFAHKVKGIYDLTVGTHIKTTTKLHVLTASEKLQIKGAGGSITIDGSGILLKGKVTIQGSLAIVGGGDAAQGLELQAHDGDDVCLSCLIEDLDK